MFGQHWSSYLCLSFSLIFVKLLWYYLIVFNVMNSVMTILITMILIRIITVLILIVVEGKTHIPLFQGRSTSGAIPRDSLVAERMWSHLYVTKLKKKTTGSSTYVYSHWVNCWVLNILICPEFKVVMLNMWVDVNVESI